MYFSVSALLAAGGFAALSQAHILLGNPPPFEGSISSPINANGDNFPCQGLTSGPTTEMQKGSTQQMSFIGSAVHGGGSCQISVTYDNPPGPNSKWKVIHSIIGGCPARGAAGNLGNDPNMQGQDQYEFTIPEDLPSGNATLAWSWLNKIGNREFYMNCASISISGDGGDESALERLPDMFIANIPQGGGCMTPEGVDVEFPDPGESVETNNPTTGPLCTGGTGGAGPAIRGRRAVRRA